MRAHLITILILLSATEAFAIPRTMYFDGVDDHLAVTNPNTLDGASRATWSFWFRYKNHWASGGDATIVGRASASGKRQFAFYADNGSDGIQNSTLFFSVHPTTSSAGSWRSPIYLGLSSSDFNSKVKNSWNHIVVVFDGAQPANQDRLRVYRNGSLIDGQGTDPNFAQYYAGSFPSVLTSPVASDLFIGVANSTGGNRFRDGLIDEVAIWANVAATQAQAAQLFKAGAPFDLAASSLGLPHNWWKGDDNFQDSGSAVDHATQVGGVSFTNAPPARGVIKRRRGRFDVASFNESGSTWTITVEGDFCGTGPAACGNVLKIDWTGCSAPDCATRRTRWATTLQNAALVTFAGYQFAHGIDLTPFIDPVGPAEPGEDIFDEDIPVAEDYFDDIPLLGWTACASGNTGCNFCVNDVLNDFAAVEKRTQHQSAFGIRTGHHVGPWPSTHYQGIARLPDNFSNPTLSNRVPIFAVTAHNPGRLWLLPMSSKGLAPGGLPPLVNDTRLGTNRLELGQNEDGAELAMELPGIPWDRTQGLFYLSYGHHLGGMQPAGAHWLAVATDALSVPGGSVAPHEGGALLIKTDLLANPTPSQVVDKIVSSFDHQVYLDDPHQVGAVAITKLSSGFYLLDLMGGEGFHAFFLSDTMDLDTTTQWFFIGQRVLTDEYGGVDADKYQSLSLFAQCSDARLFLAGASNLDHENWYSEDRMVLHVVDGSVRVLRTADRIKSIRHPSTNAPWGATWLWHGQPDAHAGYSHYHLDPVETNNNLFVKLDAEAGHTPVWHQFHLNTTDFRAGSTVFPARSNNMIVYSVAQDGGGDYLHVEEFPNRNALGLRGDNTTCLNPEDEWIAFYKSNTCTASPGDPVLIFDRYFEAFRDTADFANFNDFNDEAACVRACVAPGFTWLVCEHDDFRSCQTFMGPVGPTLLPAWLRGEVSSVRINH